jgi:hypothetical protein
LNALAPPEKGQFKANYVSCTDTLNEYRRYAKRMATAK